MMQRYLGLILAVVFSCAVGCDKEPPSNARSAPTAASPQPKRGSSVISTQNLQAMPPRDQLARRCQALAVLDLVLSPTWDDRYYSFNSQWDEKEQHASMRNGSGDGWHAHFTPHGVVVLGLDHESAAFRAGDPHPEILASVPESLASSVAEPAFDPSNLSFCLWWESSDGSWRTGAIEKLGDDGSGSLLAILDGDPARYQAFAADYFGVSLPLEVIQRVYSHERMTPALLRDLQPDRKLEDLTDELDQIGYPYGP